MKAEHSVLGGGGGGRGRDWEELTTVAVENLQKQVCVIGGLTDGIVHLKSMEFYDVDTDTWSVMAMASELWEER